MTLNEIPAWNEIESQPWFASLTPEEKQQSLQKWQGDMMQFAKDPKEKFAVAATAKAKARSFFGEEMPDDPIADALQRRQKDLGDIGSRYDAFSKGQLEEDDEEVLTLNDTLKGNTPYSVIKGRLFVSPQLVWDKAAYEKVVNEAPVDEDERVLAMSAYDGSKERAAEGVVNSLGYTDEAFRDFAAKGFKEGKSNAAILDEWKANNKLPDGILGSLRGVGRQAYFGLRSGLSGLERAMGGLGGFFGSESAQKYAEESGKEAQSYMQRTLGEGPEFIGELTSGAVSIIPTIAAGAAASFFTEGAALPAAASITAGAIQSAGATQAETYEFYRNQGLDHANALAESRVDGLVSGLITGAITHYAGKLGDKIGLGKGIEGLFSGPASKIASKLTQREISESLKAGAKAVGGSFLQEGSEELLDQAAQDAYSMIKRDPTLTLAEAINNALQAGKVGAVLGGAAEAGKLGLNSLLNSAKFSVPTTEEEEALRAKFEVPAAVEEEVIASPEVQQEEQSIKTAADVVKEAAPVAPQTAAVLAGITEEKAGELAADVVGATEDALATIEAEAPVVATKPPAEEAPAEAPAISPKPPVSPAVEPAPIGETPVASFQTSKGSTYDLLPDGTTVRNKAARPEHPGEEGIQPRSSKTIFVTEEGANALGIVQAEGVPFEIRQRKDGTWGAVALEGPSKGKFYKTSLTSASEAPAVGLIPVELWDRPGKKQAVHFGNKITSVSSQPPQGKPIETPTNALPISPATPSLPREERPEMGLQQVGEGNAQPEKVAETRSEEEVVSVKKRLEEEEKPIPQTIQALHYSREPLEVSDRVQPDQDQEFGFGFYAMEPSDEEMWKTMGRWEPGPLKNEVELTPKNPLVVTPQRLKRLIELAKKDGFSPDEINLWLSEQMESGSYDALIVRGFPNESDKIVVSKKIDALLRENWEPIFPKGKTSGKFVNVDEYNAAANAAVETVTGVDRDTYRAFERLQNQIFIPPSAAPSTIRVTKKPSPPTTGAVPPKTLPDGQEVTPGGVASPGVARDTSKPEQMTPEERGSDISPNFVNWGAFTSKKKAEQELRDRLSSLPNGGKVMRDLAAQYGLALEELYAVGKGTLPNGKTSWGIGITPKHEIAVASLQKAPVSSEAVDAYGIKLPEGYVKQGELYVYEKTQPLPKGDAAGERGAVAPAPTVEPAPEARPVSQPVQAFRDAVSQMSPTAQAKWTPELRATAEAYLDSGGTTGLQGLSDVQQKVVGRYLPEEVKAAFDAEDARKRAQRNKLPDHRESSLPPTPGKQIRKIGKGAMESVPAVLDEIAKVIPNIRDLVEVRESVEGEPDAEGFYDPQADKAVVLVDNVYLKPQHGGSQEAALRETIIHELLHRGFAKLRQTNPQLFEQFEAFSITDTNDNLLDALVRRGYTMYSNWRNDPAQAQKAREEVFVRKAALDLAVNGLDAIKSPTSLASQFFKWFKEFLSKLLGRTPPENQLIHWAQIFLNAAQADFIEKIPGERSFSMGRDLLSPEKYARHAELEAKHNAGTITPEETAEAQALVDEAAKNALARSKARENGKLMLLQHETPVAFTVFKPGGDDPSRSGPAIWLGIAGSSLKAGHTLGSRKNPNLKSMRLFADIKNPLLLDDEGMVDWAREVFLDGKSDRLKKEFPLLITEDVVNRIKAEGYDGIIFDTKEDRAEMQRRIDAHVKQMTRLGNSTSTEMKPFDKAEIIVFSPEQIKSADPFTGVRLEQRFGPSPDIRYSLADKDAEYLDAVEAGDMEKAQRMVDAAAKAAGFNVGPLYHHGGFDIRENAVPDVTRGFHLGTRRAAEERAFGKPVDDFIAEAEITYDEDLGAWFWSSQGTDSYDVIGEDGFSSEASARRSLEEFASQEDFSGSEIEDLGNLTAAYLRVSNPLVTADQKADWGNTIKRALAGGYDSVQYRNDFEDKGSTSYIALQEGQIKSADPVTYDDQGNVIPPSQRFQTVSPDIRYSLGEPPDMQEVKDRLNTFIDENKATNSFLEAFGPVRVERMQQQGEKLGPEYIQAQVRPLMQRAQAELGFEMDEEGNYVLSQRATDKAQSVLVKWLQDGRKFAKAYNKKAEKFFDKLFPGMEEIPVDSDMAAAVLLHEIMSYAKALAASSPKAEDQILLDMVRPQYGSVVLANYDQTMHKSGRTLQTARNYSEGTELGQDAVENANKKGEEKVTEELGDEALPSATEEGKVGLEAGVDAAPDIPAPADPTLRLLDLAVESLDEVAKSQSERLFGLLLRRGRIADALERAKKAGNKAMSILTEKTWLEEPLPSTIEELEAEAAKLDERIGKALTETLKALEGAKPETRKKVKAEAAKTKSKTDSIQKLIDRLSKMPDESKEAKPKAETLRAAIADAIKEKEFDEQKVRDAATKFGATPEQTERLVEEAERIHEIAQDKTPSKTKLRKFLLSHPQETLYNPEQRQALVKAFLRNEVGMDDAEIARYLPKFESSFGRAMEDARKKYLDGLEKRFNAPKKARESRVDAQNRKLLQALRAGLAETKSPKVALLERLGFKEFKPTDKHVIAKLDAARTEALANGEFAKARLKQTELSSLLLRRRPPMGWMQLFNQAWITSALSSFRNLALNVWTPLGEAVSRYFGALAGALKTGDFTTVTALTKALGEAFRRVPARFKFAYSANTFTQQANAAIAEQASLIDEFRRSLSQFRDKKLSKKDRTKAATRVVFSFGDYSRRLLQSIDESWFSVLESFISSANLTSDINKYGIKAEALTEASVRFATQAKNDAYAASQIVDRLSDYLDSLKGKTTAEIQQALELYRMDQLGISPENLAFTNEMLDVIEQLRLRSGAEGDALLKAAKRNINDYRRLAWVRAAEKADADTREWVSAVLTGKGVEKVDVDQVLKDATEGSERAASYGMGLHRVEEAPALDIGNTFAKMVEAMGQQAIRVNPMLGRMMVGFFGIPVNLMNKSLWFAPGYGALRYFAFRKMAERHPEKQFYAYSLANEKERAQRFREVIFGHAVFGLLAALGAFDDRDEEETEGLYVTLGGPANKTEKDAWLSRGFRPYSICIKHADGSVTSIPYGVGAGEFMKMPLMAAGAFDDMRLNKKLGNREDMSSALEYFNAFAAGVGRQATFLGAKNTVGALLPDTFGAGTVANLAFAAGNFFPFNGLDRSLETLVSGPPDRSRTGAILANIPYLRHLDVLGARPATNVFGDPWGSKTADPIEIIEDRLLSQSISVWNTSKPLTGRDKKLYEFIGRYQVGPNGPQRGALELRNGYLTDQEWASYRDAWAANAKREWLSSLDRMARMDEDGRAKAAAELSTRASRKAKDRFNYK